MTFDAAEILALKVTEWLFGNEEVSGVFLRATGATPNAMQEQAPAPETLAAVLDFVMMEDAWVVDAAAYADCAPQDLVLARGALPGGDLPSWT